jgi:hypothetical protein
MLMGLKEKEKTVWITSLIVSILILFFAFQPFVFSLTMGLMGEVEKTLSIATVCLILLSMVLLFLSSRRWNFMNIFLSLFSGVYLLLSAMINFNFLPTMKELADSYEPQNREFFMIGSRNYNPSSVDFAFYDTFLVILMIIFSVTAVISASLFIYNEVKRRRSVPKFKVVSN